MKKQGFVFIESVIVLMVVALSLTMLISSYSLITRKTQEKEYYDRASDKYLLYSITNIGVNDECNYNLANSCGYEGINLQADEKNCNNTRVGKLLYNCSQTFKDMNIRHIYVVDDIKKELSQDDAVEKYDNGVIEYMKTLKKCNDDSNTCEEPISYMIGVFYRSGNYYYASLKIDAITEECEEGYYLSSITKKCERIEYVIKFDKQDGSGGTNSIKVSTGNKPGNISIPSKSGYTFLGYYTEENGEGEQYYDSDGKALIVFNQSQNITLYAHWKEYIDKKLVIKKNNEEIRTLQLENNTTTTIEKESDSNIISCNNGIKISEENGKIKLDNIQLSSECKYSNELSDITNNIDNTQNNIMLLNNLDLKKQVLINQNKEVIIDMNGKSINTTLADPIVNRSKLTIKNSSGKDSSITSLTTQPNVVVNNASIMNLENIKVISNNTDYSSAVYNNGNLIVKNCYIKGPIGIAGNDISVPTFDIYNSEVIGSESFGIHLVEGGSGICNVYNSTITGKSVSILSFTKGTVNIYSGTFTSTSYIGIQNSSIGTINICSGDISGVTYDLNNISTGTINYTSKVTLKNNNKNGTNINLNNDIKCE